MLLLCTVSGSHRLALRIAVLVSGLSYAPLLRNFSLSYFSNPPVFSDGQEEAKIRITSRYGSRLSDPDNSFLISPIFHNHR